MVCPGAAANDRHVAHVGVGEPSLPQLKTTPRPLSTRGSRCRAADDQPRRPPGRGRLDVAFFGPDALRLHVGGPRVGNDESGRSRAWKKRFLGEDNGADDLHPTKSRMRVGWPEDCTFPDGPSRKYGPVGCRARCWRGCKARNGVAGAVRDWHHADLLSAVDALLTSIRRPPSQGQGKLHVEIRAVPAYQVLIMRWLLYAWVHRPGTAFPRRPPPAAFILHPPVSPDPHRRVFVPAKSPVPVSCRPVSSVEPVVTPVSSSPAGAANLIRSGRTCHRRTAALAPKHYRGGPVDRPSNPSSFSDRPPPRPLFTRTATPSRTLRCDNISPTRLSLGPSTTLPPVRHCDHVDGVCHRVACRPSSPADLQPHLGHKQAAHIAVAVPPRHTPHLLSVPHLHCSSDNSNLPPPPLLLLRLRSPTAHHIVLVQRIWEPPPTWPSSCAHRSSAPPLRSPAGAHSSLGLRRDPPIPIANLLADQHKIHRSAARRHGRLRPGLVSADPNALVSASISLTLYKARQRTSLRDRPWPSRRS